MTPFTLLTADPEPMYPRETTQDGKTKHSRHCQALFARRDFRCYRCCELLLDAAPRAGWQHAYFKRKLAQVQRRLPWT